jgi:alcohol dehydrogenase (cytochrome c)
VKIDRLLLTALLLSPVLSLAQGGGVTQSDLLNPLKDSWPTYNGDYSGKRYSALTQVNRSNVQHLTLAWMTRVTPGMDQSAEGFGRRNRAIAPVIVGGEGPGDIATHGGRIKASVLEVDGTLYFTLPDNAWAVDARDGHELWHYFWKTKGGTHIGNRGVGMWHDYLYMETPDDYLVSLEAKTGKERWHKVIANVDDGYFSTPAPIVIGNHVLVGMGNDIDSPGYLQSFDPQTGDLQWKH